MSIMYNAPTIIMAGGITFLNMTNMKRSPQFSIPFTTSDTIRFVSLSIIKGSIYGFFWPVALAGIVLDMPNKERFDSHFIPFSNSKQ